MRRAARGSDLQRHSSLFVLRMDTNGVPYVGMVPMHLHVAIFCWTRWARVGGAAATTWSSQAYSYPGVGVEDSD